jgi:hypothetical protein
MATAAQCVGHTGSRRRRRRKSWRARILTRVTITVAAICHRRRHLCSQPDHRGGRCSTCRPSVSSDGQGGLRHSALRRRPAEMPQLGQDQQKSQMLRIWKRSHRSTRSKASELFVGVTGDDSPIVLAISSMIFRNRRFSWFVPAQCITRTSSLKSLHLIG